MKLCFCTKTRLPKYFSENGEKLFFYLQIVIISAASQTEIHRILDWKGEVVAELGGSHDVSSWRPVQWMNISHKVLCFERAFQKVAGMIRTRKLALVQSYSKKLEADHVVFPWLIVHATVMVSLFEIGSRREGNLPYRPKLIRTISFFRII